MLSYKKMKKKKLFTILLSGLSIVVLTAYLMAFHNRILPGVLLCQYDLGNKTSEEAERQLSRLVPAEVPLKTVLLTYQNKNWSLNLAELEFQIKIPDSVQKAYLVGRGESLPKNIITRIKLWREREVLPLQYSINEDKLENQVATISSQIYIPAVSPQLKIIKRLFDQKEVEVEPGRNGVEVDREKLLVKIQQKLSCPNTLSLPIPIIILTPILTEQEKAKAYERGDKLLNKSLTIVFRNLSWKLDDQALLGFISFKEGWKEEEIDEYIENLKTLINEDPLNATFQIEGERVTVFKPAKEGVLLDRKKTKERFYLALKELEDETNLKDNKMEIAANLISPKIKTEDVNTLGIKELTGTGKSQFKGSIAERVHNIKLAAGKLNGLVIAPGEIFSFNQAVGDVSEATGFKKAYIIRQGRTILGDGGGVCQVSTTLFRAALNAGLPIEERHAHAYRVSYYEQDSQPGLDATVFDPNADLKFKNDTPAHILIQSKIDSKNKILVFELYGSSDGRKVEIGKAYIWDIIPPPPDLYQNDSTLPAGTVKQIDWKAWGAKVRFNWKVTRGEEILQEKTFYSQYRPWQAIFLRGTKN